MDARYVVVAARDDPFRGRRGYTPVFADTHQPRAPPAAAVDFTCIEPYPPDFLAGGVDGMPPIW